MFAHEVSRSIERFRMADPGDRLLVGVSGGADSVALAHVLDELSFPIVLAHLDHGLRPDSTEDEAFCRRLAEALGAGYVTHRADVGREAREARLSIEDAGRRARYRFFQREAERHGCRRIAVGHTMDDQAETVLLRLVRGAGVAGLGAIPPVRDAVVRPLIERRRTEVLDYLALRGSGHREDPSNEALQFARNRVRYRLMPAIRETFNPRATETLARTAELLREDESWMEAMVREAEEGLFEISPEGITLSASALLSRHPALARRLVRRALGLARGGGEAIGLVHVQAVLELARERQSGRELHLPGAVVVRSFDELRISPGSGRRPHRGAKRVYNGFEYRLPIPSQLRIPERAGTLTARPTGLASFGGGRDNGPTASGNLVVVGLGPRGRQTELSVRSPRRGDRFHPFGAPGSKPLNRYLMERKVSRDQRPSTALVVRHGRGGDAPGGEEILWVVGHSISESARREPHGEALELAWVSQ